VAALGLLCDGATISPSRAPSPTAGACAQGSYHNASACAQCPGGSVPSRGNCFAGTPYADSPWAAEFEGSCYLFVNSGVKWTDAEANCRELGGHLACLNDETEASWIVDYGRGVGVTEMWIGLNDRGNDKAYSWSNTKCCSSYRKWNVDHVEGSEGASMTTREPTGDVAGEDSTTQRSRCVRMSANAGLNKLYDDPCAMHYASVCEAPVASGAKACEPCKSGTYARGGADECTTCAFGTFAPRKGHASCVACPTWSPARLLQNSFAGAGGGDAVRCGGGLGRPQRAAYISLATLTAPAAIAVFFLAYGNQVGLGEWLRARELARGVPFGTRPETLGCSAGIGAALATMMAGTFFSAWLAPLRQQTASWPFRGALQRTTRVKACDPGGNKVIFWLGLASFVVALLFFAVSLPVLDFPKCAKFCRAGAKRAWARTKRVAARARLRVYLRRQRRKWEREENSRAAKLAVAAVRNFSCTLCRVECAQTVNEPCNHQFLCLDCASAFREENGDICNACRAPSRLVVLRQFVEASLRTDVALTEASPRSSRQPGGRDLNPTAAMADVGRLDVRLASAAQLRTAVASVKRSRVGAKRRFEGHGCAVCGLVKDLLVDMPCGHANICADCAADRADDAARIADQRRRGSDGGDEQRRRGSDAVAAVRGEAVADEPPAAPSADESGTLDSGAAAPAAGTCLRCLAPSTLTAPVRALNCSICFDEVSADYLASLGVCGHQLCTACAVGYVRAALGDVGEHVRASGIRCPLFFTGCDSAVTLDVVERLIARPVRAELRELTLPLAGDEYDRLARFFDEAAIPIAERFYCVYQDCARIFPVPDRDALVAYGRGLDPTSDALRSAKSVRGRLAALVRGRQGFFGEAHDAGGSVELTALDARAREEEAADRGRFETMLPFATCPYCERASCVRCRVPAHRLVSCADVQNGDADQLALTNAFVKATSKPCPRCSFRITHSHGHACHHIQPGTGCPNCGNHFCYRCLRKGTSGSVCGCRLFCDNDDVLAHIQLEPYPCDSRCGCTFCSTCDEGKPCEQCTGGCVVCLGIVPRGPTSAAAIASWKAGPPPPPTEPPDAAAHQI